ncbi:MAG: right-handed parallel beta-helix repeat-containing protein [bacterium]
MKSKRNTQLVLLTLLFITLISIPSVCGLLSADEGDSQVEISQTPSTTFPIVIDQPGNYILTGDITVSTPQVNGIEIMADDVTLDLNGYTLTGPGGEGTGIGISVAQRENAEIINGTVQGFFSGINLSGNNHQLKNVSACQNSSSGIEAGSSLITDCQANANGLHGLMATSSTITTCTANANGSCGMHVTSCTVTGCTASFNGSHGIYAVDKCCLEETTIRDNGGYGLYLDPDYSYAIRNVAGNNAAGNFYQTGTHYLPLSGDEANVDE